MSIVGVLLFLSLCRTQCCLNETYCISVDTDRYPDILMTPSPPTVGPSLPPDSSNWATPEVHKLPTFNQSKSLFLQGFQMNKFHGIDQVRHNCSVPVAPLMRFSSDRRVFRSQLSMAFISDLQISGSRYGNIETRHIVESWIHFRIETSFGTLGKLNGGTPFVVWEPAKKMFTCG